MTNASLRRIDETRKVQITGGSTYIFSLPKRWAVQNQLKKGTSLRVQEEDDGSLSIMPSGLEKHEKTNEALIKCFPEERPEAVTRKVVSAYLVGYNFLRVRTQAPELSSILRNHLKVFARRFLVGTEIVTDTSVELSLQVLLNYQELPVESALRRMAIIAASMHRDALAAFARNDRRLAETVVETDSEVDRFNLYIIRQLKSAIANPKLIKAVGLSSARDCLGYRLVTKSIERAADHAVKIAESSLILKQKMEPKHLRRVEEMSSLSVSMFEESIESLFRKEFGLAESVIEKTEKVIDLESGVLGSLQKTGFEELTAVRLLLESVRRTAEYASDIAEIVLNMNIDSILG
jgi:phosphate uptake regulator